MQPSANDWSQKLRGAREVLRLSRAQLARAAGVSPQTVKAYELGLRHPTRTVLASILDALKLERGLRDEILEAVGFAAMGSRIGPAAQGGYRFSPEEAAEYVSSLPWPAFILDDLMQVTAANSLVQRLWGVDIERDYPQLHERNLLRFATNPRFAGRLVNWDEVVITGIGVFKGHHLGRETISAPSSYFAMVLEGLMKGDARYVSRFFKLWEDAPPATAKVRWGYPVVWQEPGGRTLRFQAIITEANEPKGLAFNDWIPVDAVTWECLAGLRSSLADGREPD
jgi:transcriptional regulator with XRE-family HTH domain